MELLQISRETMNNFFIMTANSNKFAEDTMIDATLGRNWKQFRKGKEMEDYEDISAQLKKLDEIKSGGTTP